MSDSSNKKTPKTQPVATGGPPRPPKRTAHGLEDQPPDEPHIDIPIRLLSEIWRQPYNRSHSGLLPT